MITDLLQDVRYAVRWLRQNPGFTAVAVITLALGIGVNTAVFSVVDAVYLRPLPIPDARRLVTIFTSGKTSSGEYLRGPTSYPDLLDYRAGAPAFSGIAGFDNRGALLRVGAETVMLATCVVTENYFSTLGVSALHGRTFAEEEFRGSEAPREVVISYGLWQKHFGGAPTVIGKHIQLTGKDFIILGVLPKEFRGTQLDIAPDIFMPALVWGREELTDRGYAHFLLLGRLRPGVDLRQARVQMDTVAQRLAAAYPKYRQGRVVTVDWEPRSRLGSESLVFLGVAGLVLLIACANVAALLMARGETRRREIATRLALGATRYRIARQVLTESLMLGLLGMGIAVLLALWVITLLASMMPASVFSLGVDFRVDHRAVAFSLAATVFALVAFGIAPAVESCRVALAPELKEGGASGTTPARAWVRNSLIVGQVALSVVLLTAAGLLVRTFINAAQQDLGFDSHGQVLMMQVMPRRGAALERFNATYTQLLERISGLPGVERASLANRAPLASYGGGARKTVYVRGMELPPGEQGVPVTWGDVDSAYFEVMGTRLLRGRTFGPQDQPNSAHVAILNESAARRLFRGADAVGQHIRLGGRSGQDCEVVGLVQDGKYSYVVEDTQPYMFVPFTQDTLGDIVLLVRTRVAPASLLPAVRREISAFDSNITTYGVLTMAEHMRGALYAQRTAAQLVVALGLLGLTLAVVGLYGVLSYYVNRRRHEIGVRMAIGAPPAVVFRMLIRHGLLLAAIGIAIGTAGAFAVTRLLAGFLFGVSPHDAVTVVVVGCLLLVVAALAATGPARHAASIDPSVALRCE